MIYITAIFVILVGVVLDQYTKYLAITYLQNNPITVIKDVFELRYLENRGAAFGLLQNQQLFFLVVGVITLLIMIYIYIYMPRQRRFVPLRVCMVFIATGAIGNMIDRARFQYVVDFLYFKLIDFPIFNVADIFASVSTFAMIILLLFYYKESDIDVLFKTMSRKKRSK